MVLQGFPAPPTHRKDHMTTAPPADKKTATKTRYIILRKAEGGADKVGIESSWDIIDYADASSANAAIRSAIKTTGHYLAVPARSWKPVKVTVEQQTVVKVGDA